MGPNDEQKQNSQGSFSKAGAQVDKLLAEARNAWNEFSTDFDKTVDDLVNDPQKTVAKVSEDASKFIQQGKKEIEKIYRSGLENLEHQRSTLEKFFLKYDQLALHSLVADDVSLFREKLDSSKELQFAWSNAVEQLGLALDSDSLKLSGEAQKLRSQTNVLKVSIALGQFDRMDHEISKLIYDYYRKNVGSIQAMQSFENYCYLTERISTEDHNWAKERIEESLNKLIPRGDVIEALVTRLHQEDQEYEIKQSDIDSAYKAIYQTRDSFERLTEIADLAALNLAKELRNHFSSTPENAALADEFAQFLEIEKACAQYLLPIVKHLRDIRSERVLS